MPTARYAIYYTPTPDSPLARFGASVLGYDCFERADVPHRPIDGLNPSLLTLATVEPRRYGFHATLVAPFRLAPDTDSDALATAFSAFTASREPVMAGTVTRCHHRPLYCSRPGRAVSGNRSSGGRLRRGVRPVSCTADGCRPGAPPRRRS